MDTSKKFIYANGDSSDRDNSVCVPASTLCGIEVTSTTNIVAYFKSAVETDTLDVNLSRTTGSDPKPIIEALVNEINNGKNSRIVLGDDFSNDYFHPDVTAVTAISTESGSIGFTGNVVVGGTFAASGAISGASLSTTGDVSAQGELIVGGDSTLGADRVDKVEINGKLVQGSITQTDVDTQNHTLTAAEFLTGIVVHTTVTGAGSVTFDTGANLCSTLELEANNEMATCLYINDGAFDATLNGGTPAGVTYVNNPTIAAGSAATLVVRRTAVDTVSVYIID